MTEILANTVQVPLRSNSAEKVLSGASIVCDGAGGVTSTTADDAKWTAVDGGGNGLLTVTFPAAATTTGNRPHLDLKSAASTVTEAIFTAIDPEAGTATVRTSKAGTATDPASGDIIFIELLGKVAP
jgi:hypothetical protein